MNYIVFDLEWNQSSHPELTNERIPFEIIEIGAVKMDSKFNIIDTYSSIIKPRLYKKLQPHIRTILNYDEETLRTGRPFEKVVREFLSWCGDDFIFGTWGAMDLFYLQNNMDYYYIKHFNGPLKYYNIQQIYADVIDKEHSIAKLEKAVSHLNIPVDEDKPFHSAVNDAYYTGLVLAKIKPKDLTDRYSYDVYNNPQDKNHAITSYHKHYMEHISGTYDGKVEAMDDADITTICCYKCKKKTLPKINWYANGQNSYICVGKCWYHGLVSGKIKFKQDKNGKTFVIKTMTPTNKKGMEEIRARQDELRIKRQEKRHSKNC